MDSFNFQTTKIEKANAKIKHRKLQKVTTLFRFMELCVFLIILSRFFFTSVPIAFKFPGDYFQGFFLSLISPRFVFILGNSIVIILFLKSGNSSANQDHQVSTNDSKNDFYDEYVESCERNINQIVHSTDQHSKKQKQHKISSGKDLMISSDKCSHIEKRMRRSLSENLKSSFQSDESRPLRHVLRRTKTEKSLECVNNGDKRVATTTSSLNHVNEMSHDEFKSRVEAFIARQQRLIKEEEEEENSSHIL